MSKVQQPLQTGLWHSQMIRAIALATPRSFDGITKEKAPGPSPRGFSFGWWQPCLRRNHHLEDQARGHCDEDVVPSDLNPALTARRAGQVVPTPVVHVVALVAEVRRQPVTLVEGVVGACTGTFTVRCGMGHRARLGRRTPMGLRSCMRRTGLGAALRTSLASPVAAFVASLVLRTLVAMARTVLAGPPVVLVVVWLRHSPPGRQAKGGCGEQRTPTDSVHGELLSLSQWLPRQD